MVISLHIWSTVPSLRLASTRKMLINWTKVSGSHRDDYEAGARDVKRDTERAVFGQS